METAFTKHVEMHANLGDDTTRSKQLEFVSALRRKRDLENTINCFYFEASYKEAKTLHILMH